MEKNLSLEQLNNVAEIDVVYRKQVKCKISERPKIMSSADLYEVLMHYWDDGKIELVEEFKVLFLNRAIMCYRLSPYPRAAFQARWLTQG